MRRRFIPLVLAAALVVLLLPAAAQAITYDQAVNKLVKDGYPKAIEKTLLSFNGSALGFRSAGTPADNAAARYIAAQMRLIGLKNVRLEAVPVDSWDFKGASVAYGGTRVTASSFGGVIGTPAAGVTGQVVYAHGGSAAEFDAAGDVTGKIVLVDFESPMWWMSYPAMEAGLRGAAAIILTHSDDPDMGGYYDQLDALGCFDAESQLSAPPMVYISWRAGDALKTALGAGAVTATVKNDVRLRLADDGGVGYNVLGEIKGSRNPGQMVLYGSHHDAWFHGALDNVSAVVNELLAAKAMKMSGYRPQRTIVFFSSTAEEYGYTQSYYDWCIGAWHAITQRHPGWSGRIAGFLNSELVGYKKGNLWMLASPEITPTLDATLAASTDLTLTKNTTTPAVIGGPWSWNDQWTFTAAGVPSVCFWSQDNDYSGDFKKKMYHTQYDAAAQMDYKFLGEINKYEFRVAKKFAASAGLLPYDFTKRSDDLAAALSAQVSSSLGSLTYDQVLDDAVDDDVYDAFEQAVGGFGDAASDYAAGKASIPAADIPSVNARLMAVDKLLNTGLTGLDWLDNISYPFKQTAFDVAMMDQAIAEIDYGYPSEPNWQDMASADVASVGLMWYGINFSHQVFLKELQRHRQTYYRICWGGQGHLDKYQDLTPEYNTILAGDDARPGLEAKVALQKTDLAKRLDAMTDCLNEASDQIHDLLPPIK